MYIFYIPNDIFEISFNPIKVEELRGEVKKLDPAQERYLLDPGIYYGHELLVTIDIAEEKMMIGRNYDGEPFSTETGYYDERKCDEQILNCIREWMEERIEGYGRWPVPRYVALGMTDATYAQLVSKIQQFLNEVEKLRKTNARKDKPKQLYTALDLLKYINRR